MLLKFPNVSNLLITISSSVCWGSGRSDSHLRSSSSIPDLYMSWLWWKKWHGDTVLQLSSVGVIPPVLHALSFIYNPRCVNTQIDRTVLQTHCKQIVWILSKIVSCKCVERLRHGKICLSYHREIRALNMPDGISWMTFVLWDRLTECHCRLWLCNTELEIKCYSVCVFVYFNWWDSGEIYRVILYGRLIYW